VLRNLTGGIHIEKKAAAAKEAVEVIVVPEGTLVANAGGTAEADRSVAAEMAEVRVEVAKAAASDRNAATIVEIAVLPRGKQSSRRSRRPLKIPRERRRERSEKSESFYSERSS
jgi:hypothetical protein